MNKIKIPYVEKLDHTDIISAADTLDLLGEKGTIESVNWPHLYNYKPITIFYIARSKTSIFIKFDVRGNLLKAVYAKDQEPVHEDSCVEFFCNCPEVNTIVILNLTALVHVRPVNAKHAKKM